MGVARRLRHLECACALLGCLSLAWGDGKRDLIPGPPLREIARDYAAASGKFCSDGIESGQAADMCNLASSGYPEGSAADLLMAGR
jgi:hypothetical protein